VRAAVAWNVEAARLSRAHNDANVLCVGARLVPEATAFAVVDAYAEVVWELAHELVAEGGELDGR
jgi:ribose 5-phosphate isomerase B